MRSSSLRHLFLAFLTALALSATAGEARAQSGRGSIAVGATILPAPPGALRGPLDIELAADGRELLLRGEPSSTRLSSTIFIRVQPAGSSPAQRTFIGRRVTMGTELHVGLPHDARSSGVQLERLIVAGT